MTCFDDVTDIFFSKAYAAGTARTAESELATTVSRSREHSTTTSWPRSRATADGTKLEGETPDAVSFLFVFVLLLSPKSCHVRVSLCLGDTGYYPHSLVVRCELSRAYLATSSEG